MDKGLLVNNLPHDIIELISVETLEANGKGCSKSLVYKAQLKNSDDFAYLKVTKKADEDFHYELNLLRWLDGKIPVPLVLSFEERNGLQYLLMSEVAGIDSSDTRSCKDAIRLVSLLAEGLKMIHAVDVIDCPFDQRLNVKLRNAGYNIRHKLVDLDDIKRGNPAQTPEIIYKMLESRMPSREDLVFTHGDYCLPNIIIKNDKISGFIDWGRGGVSDRHQDIALCCRSITYNLNSPGLVEVFLRKYGLDMVDRNKIDYYILLDELF